MINNIHVFVCLYIQVVLLTFSTIKRHVLVHLPFSFQFLLIHKTRGTKLQKILDHDLDHVNQLLGLFASYHMLPSYFLYSIANPMKSVMWKQGKIQVIP